MVDPPAAARNFAHLAEVGGRGRYGWYEALDYTKTRLPEGTNVAVVRAYMAHHQGMTVVAIANALHEGAMRTRFHAEPIIQATELLLQERMPRDVAIVRTEGPRLGKPPPVLASSRRRRSAVSILHTPVTPRAHLLSNGRYAVMITAAGSGYSRWRDIAVTRWREDVTRDHWGSYIFLRDIDSGEVWSAGYQPSGAEADRYDVTFSEGRAEIIRHDGTITTTLEVAVSSEDDAEVRRVSITNLGNQVREIELTSYAEIALAPNAADDAHPAFSKLFVETEFVADAGAHSGNSTATIAELTPRPGQRISLSSKATQSATCSSRLTARASLGADAEFEDADGRDRWVAALRHGRRGARSDLQPSPPCASRRHESTARVAFWTLIAPHATKCSILWTSITTRWRLIARPHWPGRKHKCSSVTSE